MHNASETPTTSLTAAELALLHYLADSEQLDDDDVLESCTPVALLTGANARLDDDDDMKIPERLVEAVEEAYREIRERCGARRFLVEARPEAE